MQGCSVLIQVVFCFYREVTAEARRAQRAAEKISSAALCALRASAVISKIDLITYHRHKPG